MRRIILSLHVTLDGFVAGPHGEMDWIKVDDEMFEIVGKVTADADTALYGRVTYQMMDSYWPTAGENPNASKHDIEHSSWYNRVEKVVLSRTMKDADINKTTIISDNVSGELENLKKQPGANIMMIGSPSAAHTLMQHNLIDEYWLFVNPIILGEGIPTFTKLQEKIQLNLLKSKQLAGGVTALHYEVVR